VRVAVLCCAEGKNARNPLRARMRLQPLELRIVGRKNGHTPGLDALKDFRFGVRDRFDRPEIFEMRGRDGRNHRHMRPDLLHQCTNFASVVHAELEHAKSRVAAHARQAQWHAPVVVEGCDRCRHGSATRKNKAQHLFRGRLAGAPRNRDDAGVRAGARRTAESFESRLGVGYNEQRRIQRDIVGPRAHECGSSAFLEPVGDEFVTVLGETFQRDIKITALDRAGIDGNAKGLPRPLRLTAGRGLRFGRCPERNSRAHA